MSLSALIAASFLATMGGNFDANLSERSIVDCLELTDDTERLACYDRNATLLRAAITASEQGEPVPAGEEQRTAKRRGLGRIIFGKRAPEAEVAVAPSVEAAVSSEEEFGLIRRDGNIKAITSDVTSLSLKGNGVAVVVLENGQVWQQIKGDNTHIWLSKKPKKYSVTIKIGALNSYRMKIEPIGKTIRVRRVK